jgi:hypothetical protein
VRVKAGATIVRSVAANRTSIGNFCDRELLRSGTFAGRFAPKAIGSQLMSARGQERSKTATSTSQQRII